MATPFSKAWDILKYFKNPHDEERSYGGVSMREHPLFGMPGYEGTRRDSPREMAEMDDPSMQPMLEDVAMSNMPMPKRSPPLPIGERGSMNPEMAAALAEIERRKNPDDEVGSMGSDREESMSMNPSDLDDASPLQTIPMSPRGSVKGRGERQAVKRPGFRTREAMPLPEDRV